MKMRLRHIIVLIGLSVFFVSCGKPDPQGDCFVSPELTSIDSLMWQQPDSALAMLMDYLADDGREVARHVSTDETYNNHYAQLLASELLFKNDKAQTNRAELKAAMMYFDSLVARDDRNATTVFLDARAHYIDGVGYKEHDSLPEACAEYLRALQIMENRFAENELTGRKTTFMSLTYNRLLELFSNQLMQEPAIYCCKQSLHYDEIEPVGATNRSGILYFIGRQYHKLNAYDSAAYYFDAALTALPDTHCLYYRDIVSAQALLEFNRDGDPQHPLHTLKGMLARATGESERMTRNVAIGAIYKEEQQYDSAKAYWEPVFEKDPMRAKVVAPHLSEIAMSEGDTAKASLYAQAVAQKASSAGEKQARVSQLNDLFQGYLNQKQERKAEAERRQAVKKAIGTVVPLAFLMALALIVIAKRRSKRQLKEQQAMAQQEMDVRDRQYQESVKQQQEAALQQVRALFPQRVADIYHSKANNRVERIMAEFEVAYPKALDQLAEAHPDLTETERQIAVLNFLQFRAKEEADLLGLAENTILKYRSNLNKKAGPDPISALIEE